MVVHFKIIVKGMPLLTYLKGMPGFLREYREIRRQAEKSGNGFPFGKPYPCLADKGQGSGVLAEHYFYQDLYCARKVFQNNPARHVDIGSRIDGFVSHVASFREIEVLDVRDLPPAIPGIRFTRADLPAQTGGPGGDNSGDLHEVILPLGAGDPLLSLSRIGHRIHRA